MSFKIVSTLRRGRPELCTVPSQWEHKGQLRWPRYNADLLTKDSSVQPRADWLTMSCSVKRKKIQSYEDAEEELTNMLNKPDTDTDLDQNSCAQPYRTVPNYSTGVPNYNSMAQDLIDPMPMPSRTPDNGTDAESVIYEVVSEGSEVPTTTSYRHFTSQEATQQSLVTHSDQTLEAINNIYAIQQLIMENQDKIMKKLAEMSVQIEELNNNRQPLATIPLGQAKGIEMESFMIRAINDIKNLEKLEQELKNKEIFEKLRQQYSIVCSESRENGINCAYRLLDLVFTKEFLCKCTWTGGSRNAVDVKIGFKAFKNVINFFFILVNSWDATYTMQDNEKFFKTVLRNALKRKEMKNIRSSSAKKRRVTVTCNKENQQRDDDEMINEENEESLC